MAFCRNCGQQIPDGASFCASCGTPTDAQSGSQNSQNGQQYAAQTTPSVSGDADVAANKSIAWFSYLGPFILIPLLARKNSDYCRYHVKQGANLFAVSLAYTIVTEILKAIIRAIFPGQLKYGILTYYYADSPIYLVFKYIFMIGSILIFVAAIIGIVNAATGKKQPLPFSDKVPFIPDLMDKIYAALDKNEKK